MTRGGFRPGSGRPRGSKTARLPTPTTTEAEAGGLSPLGFLLAVVADEGQPVEVRLRAAAVAAPYVHPKAEAPSAKARREEAAETAEKGTDWESLLAPTLPGRA